MNLYSLCFNSTVKRWQMFWKLLLLCPHPTDPIAQANLGYQTCETDNGKKNTFKRDSWQPICWSCINLSCIWASIWLYWLISRNVSTLSREKTYTVKHSLFLRLLRTVNDIIDRITRNIDKVIFQYKVVRNDIILNTNLAHNNSLKICPQEPPQAEAGISE